MPVYAEQMLHGRQFYPAAAILIRHASLAVVLFTSIMFSSSLSAQSIESENARLIAERPGVDDTSTEITLSVFLIDIDEINDVRQRFRLDMFVNIIWQDPRLALPETAQSDQIPSLPIVIPPQISRGKK